MATNEYAVMAGVSPSAISWIRDSANWVRCPHHLASRLSEDLNWGSVFPGRRVCLVGRGEEVGDQDKAFPDVLREAGFYSERVYVAAVLGEDGAPVFAFAASDSGNGHWAVEYVKGLHSFPEPIQG